MVKGSISLKKKTEQLYPKRETQQRQRDYIISSHKEKIGT